MRKQATEAQRQAAKERRDRFRAIVKTLGKMSDVERFELSKRVSIGSCEGYGYSPCNQMLIAMQCPTATVLGGFRQWKKLGRTVKRGEHGHMIWVPTVYEKTDDIPQPSEVDGEERPKGVRFIIGTIFDISQTSDLSEEAEGQEVAA